MESTSFGKVHKGRFADQVVDMLAAQILDGRLTVGDRLPSEKELTEQFNVSRTVIREALRTLEEGGLVEIRKGPGGGAFITLSLHKPVSNFLKNLITHGKLTLDDLFDVRALIEPHIAFQAALRAKPSDLKPLKKLISESKLNLDDVVLLKTNNIRFHLLLSRASGNLVLTILMESIVEMVAEFSREFSNITLGRKHLELHTQLLKLIEKGRADEAKDLISRDVQEVREMLRNFMSNSGLEVTHGSQFKNKLRGQTINT